MLLVGAGLLLQSFARLTRGAGRLQAGRAADASASRCRRRLYADPAAMRSFIARLMPRLDATPGVAHAAASMALPPAITTMAPYVTGDQPMVAIGERPWAMVGDHA